MCAAGPSREPLAHGRLRPLTLGPFLHSTTRWQHSVSHPSMAMPSIGDSESRYVVSTRDSSSDSFPDRQHTIENLRTNENRGGPRLATFAGQRNAVLAGQPLPHGHGCLAAVSRFCRRALRRGARLQEIASAMSKAAAVVATRELMSSSCIAASIMAVTGCSASSPLAAEARSASWSLRVSPRHADRPLAMRSACSGRDTRGASPDQWAISERALRPWPRASASSLDRWQGIVTAVALGRALAVFQSRCGNIGAVDPFRLHGHVGIGEKTVHWAEAMDL